MDNPAAQPVTQRSLQCSVLCKSKTKINQTLFYKIRTTAIFHTTPANKLSCRHAKRLLEIPGDITVIDHLINISHAIKKVK